MENVQSVCKRRGGLEKRRVQGTVGALKAGKGRL